MKYIECGSRDGNDWKGTNSDGNDWKGMKSSDGNGKHDTKWINGTLYFLVWIWNYWDESLASLFVCGKRVCCYCTLVCLLLSLLLLLLWILVCTFFFSSSGDGCSAYFFVERLHTRSVLALLVFRERFFVFFYLSLGSVLGSLYFCFSLLGFYIEGSFC